MPQDGERKRNDGRYARFVARENRFVVRARLDSGAAVRAYLPNTARLGDVLVPDALLVLEPNDAPHRRTRWTATRVWDRTWVALDAAAAAGLVADHLEGGGALAGWPPATAVRREVARIGQRLDLGLTLPGGAPAVVEVKSLSHARNGVAPLSRTPSDRGVAHLAALGTLARDGHLAAAVFVVQRGDVEAVDVSAPADPRWVAAVRRARTEGVHVAAYRCDVEEHRIRLGDPIPVRDRPSRPG
jgi:DNA-binding sugar fermentation-stimulating protein